MSLPSLLALISPAAVYRLVPLDPRLNALGPWQEAAEKFVAPDDKNPVWAGLAYATQAWAMQVLPDDAESARQILRQNAECIDALDRGLQRGQLQFEELQSLDELSAHTDFVSRLGEIVRLYLLRFRLWFSEGDLVSAAEEVFRLEKIGSMICNGEGQMLHYLVGLWLRAAAVRGFGYLAASPRRRRLSWSGSWPRSTKLSSRLTGWPSRSASIFAPSPWPNWTVPWTPLTWQKLWTACWRSTMFRGTTGRAGFAAPSTRPSPMACCKSAAGRSC